MSKEQLTKLETPFVVVGGVSIPSNGMSEEGMTHFYLENEHGSWGFELCDKSSLTIGELEPSNDKDHVVTSQIGGSKVTIERVITSQVVGSKVTINKLTEFVNIYYSEVEANVLGSSTITGSKLKSVSLTNASVRYSVIENAVIKQTSISSSNLLANGTWDIEKSDLVRVNKPLVKNTSGKEENSDTDYFLIKLRNTSLINVELNLSGNLNYISNCELVGLALNLPKLVGGGKETSIEVTSPFNTLSSPLGKDYNLTMVRMASGGYTVSFGDSGEVIAIGKDDSILDLVKGSGWAKSVSQEGEKGQSMIQHAIDMLTSRINVSEAVLKEQG